MSTEPPARDYYSNWDRWFHEEHDGTPCEWIVYRSHHPEDPAGDDSYTFTPTKPSPSLSPDEEHTVVHRIMASSYIEAMDKYHGIMGYKPYKPFEDWDVENNRWRR
jgi:hypothetical protein